MSIDPELEQKIRGRLAESAFAHWMGFRLAALGAGESEIRFTLEPHHLNPGRIAHGGVIASLLDAAIGIALRSRLPRDREHVTVHLDVQYLTPVREGALVARGSCVRAGSRTGYGEAELLTEDGRLVAKGSATFLVVPGDWDRDGADDSDHQ